MKFHQTNAGRHNDARKRVRMACAFGHLTIGPLHNGLGRNERPDQAGLPPDVAIEHDLLPEVRFGDRENQTLCATHSCDAGARGVTAPPIPVVTVRRRMRTTSTIP